MPLHSAAPFPAPQVLEHVAAEVGRDAAQVKRRNFISAPDQCQQVWTVGFDSVDRASILGGRGSVCKKAAGRPAAKSACPAFGFFLLVHYRGQLVFQMNAASQSDPAPLTGLSVLSLDHCILLTLPSRQHLKSGGSGLRAHGIEVFCAARQKLQLCG